MKIKRAGKVLEKINGGKVYFGMALRSYRTREDITQQELADHLGVSKKYLSDLENKRRFVSIEKAAEYARILGENEKYFVTLSIRDQIHNSGLGYEIFIDFGNKNYWRPNK